jgi:hypothetical protein
MARMLMVAIVLCVAGCTGEGADARDATPSDAMGAPIRDTVPASGDTLMARDTMPL